MKNFLTTILKLTIVSLACVALCACESVGARYYPLSNNIVAKSPRPVSEIEMFITKKPDYKYEEMGMITYEIPSSYSDELAVYNILRQKAAEIGADAIIIMNSQSTIDTLSKITFDYYGNPIETESPRAYTKYRAMAILKK